MCARRSRGDYSARAGEVEHVKRLLPSDLTTQLFLRRRVKTAQSDAQKTVGAKVDSTMHEKLKITCMIYHDYLRPPDLLTTVFQSRLLNQSLAYCPRPHTPYLSPRYDCPNKFNTAKGNGRGLDIPDAVGLTALLALLASPRPDTSLEACPAGASDGSGICAPSDELDGVPKSGISSRPCCARLVTSRVPAAKDGKTSTSAWLSPVLTS